MNSSTSRITSKKESQEEIKRQIALLEARLQPEKNIPQQPKSPKRKAGPLTLAPATPSPRKKRKVEPVLEAGKQNPLAQPNFKSSLALKPTALGKSTSLLGKESKQPFLTPAPSTLLSKLASTSNRDDEDATETIARSSGFAEKAPNEVVHSSGSGRPGSAIPRRDDRLAIIEDFEPGPYEHTPPSDDPKFNQVEPHSGIRLSSRVLSHDDFSDYLRGRYYLSPSRLYSCVKLLPDKRGYDVPVDGDWITVAVIAERGPLKFTRAPVAVEREEGDEPEGNANKNKNKKSTYTEKRNAGKKFISLKLVDFGARSSKSSSANGGTSVIRGDAFLNLLLFEADSCDHIIKEGKEKPEPVYKGGSRGAFESMFNVREGDVVALLNPKILKPYQRANDAPHPVDNVLAVTPESASSIIVMGRATDLGRCNVRKKDGKICGSWCDKRISEVCEFHVHVAVSQRRAARPEFTASTMNLSTSAKHKAKHANDPLRQWGLVPEENDKQSTYIVSGHVVSGSSNDPRTLYVTETIGREGQAKAQRKLNGDGDKALKRLLERDKDGMKAVMQARRAGKTLLAEQNAASSSKSKDTKKGKLEGKGKVKEQAKDLKGKRKRSAEEEKEVHLSSSSSSGNESDDPFNEESRTKTKGYSASVIKCLGFDPALKASQPSVDNVKLLSKIQALEAVRTSRKSINLDARPGPKIRSGVKAPVQPSSKLPPPPVDSQEDEKMIDLDDF